MKVLVGSTSMKFVPNIKEQTQSGQREFAEWLLANAQKLGQVSVLAPAEKVPDGIPIVNEIPEDTDVVIWYSSTSTVSLYHQFLKRLKHSNDAALHVLVQTDPRGQMFPVLIPETFTTVDEQIVFEDVWRPGRRFVWAFDSRFPKKGTVRFPNAVKDFITHDISVPAHLHESMSAYFTSVRRFTFNGSACSRKVVFVGGVYGRRRMAEKIFGAISSSGIPVEIYGADWEETSVSEFHKGLLPPGDENIRRVYSGSVCVLVSDKVFEKLGIWVTRVFEVIGSGGVVVVPDWYERAFPGFMPPECMYTTDKVETLPDKVKHIFEDYDSIRAKQAAMFLQWISDYGAYHLAKIVGQLFESVPKMTEQCVERLKESIIVEFEEMGKTSRPPAALDFLKREKPKLAARTIKHCPVCGRRVYVSNPRYQRDYRCRECGGENSLTDTRVSI
jgi:hypothetical protein